MRSHLIDMENTLSDLLTEMKYHKQQVNMIKSEKETLDSVLSMKIEDAKKTVQNEEKRYFYYFQNKLECEMRWKGIESCR